MTKAQIETLETSLRVLNDIKSLRQNAAFERYWMARIREKRAKLLSSYLEEPANESTRRVIKAYDEILGLMDGDEHASQNTVNAINPEALKPTRSDSHAS